MINLAVLHVRPTPTPPQWAVCGLSTYRKPEHHSSSPEPQESPDAPEYLNQVLQAGQVEVREVQLGFKDAVNTNSSAYLSPEYSLYWQPPRSRLKMRWKLQHVHALFSSNYI